MQKAPNTAQVVQKEGLTKMGWYRWNCPCCGPKNGKARTEYHRTERRSVSDLPENWEGDADFELE